MTNGRAIHHSDDGTETDITEGVQALYDLVINSMNWGSGFWTAEDALPVAQIGRLLGFERIDEVERYVAERQHDIERQEWLNTHPTARNPISPRGILTGWYESPIDHDHVLSSVRRCMWPRCNYRD